MLLAISDLHLTDETVSDVGVRGSALKTVLQDLASAAETHNRHGGVPIDRLDILLVGDVFDLLRTSYWDDVPEDECPWSPALISEPDPQSPAAGRLIEHAGSILEHILATPNARDLCAVLQEAARGWGPFKSVGMQFITGNHDRLINHRAAGVLRARVRAAFGGACGTGQDCFANSVYLEAYQTFARHGHEYDPWNFEPVQRGVWDAQAYERCPIGDVITFALVTKLYLEVRTSLDPNRVSDPVAKAERQRLVDGLRVIEDIRPISLIPVWLKAFLRGSELGEEVGRVVAKVAREFRRLAYFEWWRRHSVWDTRSPFQPQDLFAGMIRLLAEWESVPTGRLGDIFKFYAREDQNGMPPGVMVEEILTGPTAIRNTPVQHVLCAHTHVPDSALVTVIDSDEWAERCRQAKQLLDAPRDVAAGPGRQVWYLNTGTMRNRVSMARVSQPSFRFAPVENLSYVVIHRPGEKYASGFAADLWSGARVPIEA